MTTDLKTRVDEWLAHQGFPLEFRAAQAFSRSLRTFQGTYVRDPVSGQMREVDVIATQHLEDPDVICRTSVVVECKWSQDKPWVIFTSANGKFGREAAVAQTLGSAFSEAVMWHLAIDQTLQDHFYQRQPQRIGFGGRQAFVEKNDKEQFYPAIQGVVAAAVSVATNEDPPAGHIKTAGPMIAHVVYPVIVVDGTIFECYLNGSAVETSAVSRVRVAWRGHASRTQPVLVDIVSADALNDFAAEISLHCHELAAYIQNPARVVRNALLSKDLTELKRTRLPAVPAPRLLQGIL